MRTEVLCLSVLRVASGPRVKLASCKSVSPTLLLLCGLFYEAICCMSYYVLLCSSVFLSF